MWVCKHLYFVVLQTETSSNEWDSEQLVPASNTMSDFEVHEICTDLTSVYIRETSSDHYCSNLSVKKNRKFTLKSFISRIFSLKL